MHEVKFDWFSENREYLIGHIQHAKFLLGNLLTRNEDIGHSNAEASVLPTWQHETELPSLELLAQTFHLSDFEKMIVVLCAGAEIDGEVSMMCSKLYKDPKIKFPTFDLALRALPEAEWDAFLPDSALRHYRLIEIHDHEEDSLITNPIKLPERLLHYLLGFKSGLDINLEYLVSPVEVTAPLAPSHNTRVEDIVEYHQSSLNKTKLPIFQLCGPDKDSCLIVAQNASDRVGLGLWEIPGELIPNGVREEQHLSGLLSRECFITGNAIFIDAFDIEESAKKIVARFAARSVIPLVFVGSREPWPIQGRRPMITLGLKRATRQDQRLMWKECIERYLPADDLKNTLLAEIDRIANRFSLDASSIESICTNIAISGVPSGSDMDWIYSILQNSTYRLTKNRLGDLAEEIIPVTKMEDIVLPASRKNMIKTVALHFRHRRKVYDEWGFAKKSSRGLGIIALFSGESGTGKTMAAEALARELGMDIYRIDLSMVASKYVGETEKNLKQIFDAAETRECILFFDEADSLFGKRSEVRDSHDRYANMQVGYLLQRIESYDGIVILATNFKKSLDSAFMRRVRFVIDFPFPDEKSREEIWRGIFPQNAPLDNIDFRFLSKLSITGGSIRNIALNAAFLAADEKLPVNMKHIQAAAEEEYVKLGRIMSTAEIGNWP